MVPGSVSLGILASLATAALWGLSAVVARLGMIHARPSSVNFVNILVALPILSGIAVATGGSVPIGQLGVPLLLVVAGVALCAQVGGNLLTYDSIRFIGASRSATVSGVRILFSAALGVAFLAERVNPPLLAGTALILVGVAVITVRERRASDAGFKIGRGAAEAMAGGLVFSVGNVLIPVATSLVGSAVAANLMADLVALPILVVVVLLDAGRAGFLPKGRKALGLLVLNGVVGAAASYTFFVALSAAPVVYVVPLSSSSPLFAVAISLVAIRTLELVDRRVVLGALLTIAGSLLVALPLQ